MVLLGDADEIVQYLCAQLGKGWVLPPPLAENPKERQALAEPPDVAGAAIVEEVPSLEKRSTVGSVSPGSAGTGTSTADKEKGKAKESVKEVKVKNTPMVEPTRIGARYVVLLFIISLRVGGKTCSPV